MRGKAVVVAAWLLLIVYAYPGYMNWDAGDQLFQARHFPRHDWHPPIMAAYWHVLELIVRGPLLMLLLQTGLFTWGVYAAYRRRLAERHAQIAAALTLLFPPVLTPMTAVWKDAQMAGFLIAGLLLAVSARPRTRIAGLVLLALGIAVRDNAAAAVPPLMLFIVAAWGVRRRLAIIGIGAAVTIALVASAAVTNRALTQKRAFPWYRTVAIHDLAGTICHEKPITDAEVRDQLAGIPTYVDHDLQAAMCRAYTPRAPFQLEFGDGRIFHPVPEREDRLARRQAWVRAVRDHTGAWLAHRWAVMREVLGLTSSDLWEPVCQTIQANAAHAADLHHDATLSPLQEYLGTWYSRLAKTVVYRPWAYALGCILLLAFAIYRRDGWIAALAGSGLLYEASYFLGACAPDYRYSHWMVTCCIIAAVTIFVERYQSGRRTPA